MRATRPALCLALVASVTLAGAASAATKPKPKPAKPVCNLVVDDKDDASILTKQPTMDIVSGDVASNAKSLTAVLRLAATPNGQNPEGGQSSRYYFEFNAPGSDNPQYLVASVAFPTGDVTFRTGQITPSANGSTFTNDPVNPDVKGAFANNVLTMSAPLAAFTRVKLTPGTKLTSLKGETFALIGVLLEPADEAVGSKAYTAGALSCVKP